MFWKMTKYRAWWEVIIRFKTWGLEDREHQKVSLRKDHLSWKVKNELTEGWSCWKNPGKENKMRKGTVKEITWCDWRNEKHCDWNLVRERKMVQDESSEVGKNQVLQNLVDHSMDFEFCPKCSNT